LLRVMCQLQLNERDKVNDLILSKMREGDWGAVVKMMREE